MGKGMISLKCQALDRIGKNWGKGSLTREKALSCTKLFARFLDRTYHLQRIENVKPGMIDAYVAGMKAEGLSPSTMAARMTAVRVLCAAVGKKGICHRDNKSYGIERVRVSPQPINYEKLDEIRGVLQQRADSGDPVAKMMVAADALRTDFGLRFKEALMTKDVVSREGKLYLQIEGAKGGRPREILARTEGQLKALALVKSVSKAVGSGTGRIIPASMTLKQAYNAVRNRWRALGGTRANHANAHGERHGFARERVGEGATSAQLMEELGHGSNRSPASYIPRQN